jgi:hypothetical protein
MTMHSVEGDFDVFPDHGDRVLAGPETAGQNTFLFSGPPETLLRGVVIPVVLSETLRRAFLRCGCPGDIQLDSIGFPGPNGEYGQPVVF